MMQLLATPVSLFHGGGSSDCSETSYVPRAGTVSERVRGLEQERCLSCASFGGHILPIKAGCDRRGWGEIGQTADK